MKRMILASMLALLLAMALGCGTTFYSVTTNGGKTYTSQGQPELDEDAGTYTFTDLDGNKVILNKGEVSEIKSKAAK